ncbi:hypothetical protein Lser_V15G08577 [Lactuca serriola]
MLSEAFWKYGKIVDIYIPGRKDRAGSYFAKRYNNYKQTYRPHRVHHVQLSTIPGDWSKISEGKTFADAVTGRKEKKIGSFGIFE